MCTSSKISLFVVLFVRNHVLFVDVIDVSKTEQHME